MSATRTRYLPLPAALTAFALLASSASAVADDERDDLTETEVSDEAREASVAGLRSEESVVPLQPEDFIDPMREEETDGDTTTVTIATDILFEFDEAEPEEQAQGALRDLSGDIDGISGTVEIVGHTDGIGDDSYNQELSEQRAEAVQELLETELGASAPEFETEGRGSNDPVAEETTSDGEDNPTGRARNRRVEVSYTDGA